MYVPFYVSVVRYVINSSTGSARGGEINYYGLDEESTRTLGVLMLSRSNDWMLRQHTQHTQHTLGKTGELLSRDKYPVNY